MKKVFTVTNSVPTTTIVYKLATGHYLIVSSAAPHEIVPTDCGNTHPSTAREHANHLRALADLIIAADKRLRGQA